jgi:glucokinase
MLAVGVDLGGTNLRVAVGDEEGKILRRLEERVERDRGPEGVGKQIIRMIHSLDLETKEIAGIGIGSLGPLDIRRGVIVLAPNLPFNNVPLKEPLEKVFPCPIRVVNDCSAAVLGERVFGAGRGIDNLCYVTISSGIGCGAYVDGRLLLGKDGNAHEMGHTIIDYSGRLACGCGRRGHWEAYCSGNNIPNYVRLWIKENRAENLFAKSRLAELLHGNISGLSSKMVFDCAGVGDELCLRILEDVGRLNAVGFANTIASYDPELITVGGSVTLNNQSMVMEPVRRHVVELSVNRVPEIKVTPLGQDIVLYGALAMSFTRYLG